MKFITKYYNLVGPMGTGKLVRVEVPVGRNQIQSNPRCDFFQSVKDLRLELSFIFQQYNIPKHTAKGTLEWFKTKKPNEVEQS